MHLLLNMLCIGLVETIMRVFFFGEKNKLELRFNLFCSQFIIVMTWLKVKCKVLPQKVSDAVLWVVPYFFTPLCDIVASFIVLDNVINHLSGQLGCCATCFLLCLFFSDLFVIVWLSSWQMYGRKPGLVESWQFGSHMLRSKPRVSLFPFN